MEESKAAEYYEELTRKGEGAAKFKQGLGFSSGSSNHDNNFPVRGSALPSSSSSSSLLSSFVRASSPSKTSEFDKEAQLKNIQNKLRKKPDREVRVSDRRNGGRSRSRSRSRERDSRRRRRSSSRDRDRRMRKRSRSDSDEERRRRRDRRRSRSISPSRKRGLTEKKGKVDYSRVIKGYEEMVCLMFEK